MTTEEIAAKLVSLCRQGKYEEVYQDLYDPNIESIEPNGSTWSSVKGMDALKKKGEEWNKMVKEFHGGEISDPIVAGDYFSCTMKTSLTLNGMTAP